VSIEDIRAKLASIEADFWDCDEDAERLNHEHPESAIEYDLDSCWPLPHVRKRPGFDAEAWIRDELEDGGLTVYAWKRSAITEAQLRDCAETLVERACEVFAEDDELGDPEGDDDDGLTPAVQAKHLPLFEAAVRALWADATVWHCEILGKVALTTDEVLELVRAEWPEWLEKESA